MTDSDTFLRALTTGLDALTYFLDNLATKQDNFVTLVLPSGGAINRALDTSPHGDQQESISIMKKLSAIFESHSKTNIVFLWIPTKIPFVGLKRARQLALEAIRIANLVDITEPYTISNQEKTTKDAAITTWAERWHRLPHTSKAYRTALTTPPDGKPHHTFHLAHTRDSSKGDNAVKFSRLTHSTLYRLITGHAFTGEYTQRFFPQHTPDQIACQCGEPLQTADHILFKCTNFADARRRHLTVNGRPRTFPQLLETPKRAQSLLRFLEETRACSKPRAVWNPG